MVLAQARFALRSAWRDPGSIFFALVMPVGLYALIVATQGQDAGEVFVVLPEHPWWTDHPKWVSGKPLDDGFIYASNTNDEWLGPDELAAVLDA